MDQDNTPPPTPTPPRRTSSNPAAAATPAGPFAASSSTTRSPVRGPTSSPMLLGMSSSPAQHSPRRSSPSSLYPPPAPGSVASGSGSSSGSPSRFRQQIRSSPQAARGGRPSPSPVLSELATIRSVGAARATSQQRSEMRAATLYGGRPLHQALPSWSAMYSRSRLGTPPPSRSFSGVAPPASSPQLQPPRPSNGTLTPQPSHSFSFPGFATSVASQQAQPSSSVVRPPAGGIPSPAMQQQQAISSFTDLAPLPGGSGGIFSGLAPAAPPASQQPEAMSSFSDLAATQPAFRGGQPLQQAWPSFPSGGFSGFAPPASQQLQPSSSGVPLQPDGTFSGYPSPAMVQPHANSSSTDLLSGSGIFSDLPLDLPISGSEIAPASSQQPQETSSFTTLKPLPSGTGSFSAGLAPGHGQTAMSLQLAAPPAASDTTMYGHGGQQPSSNTELPPLPPTLQIRPDEVMQFSQQPAGNDDSTFSEPEAARMHTPRAIQVKKEPVDIGDDTTQCLHEPELITVDDDEEMSALLNSFRSPNEPGSLGVEHTSTDQDMPQHDGGGVGSSSSGPSALGGAVEGSGQSWMTMLTPYDTVTTGASIPWNCDGYTMSMSQQLPIQPQQGDLFSTGVSDVAPYLIQPSENNILSGFGQQQLQAGLQMPTMLSATELLQLISMPCPIIWSTGESSGQGAVAVMPDAAASADMFGQMSIGGGTMMSVGPGWPEAAMAANQYAMFDTSAWAAAAVPDQMASKFDQMSMSEGSLNIGQGWPATPAPTFGIPGSSSSSACASMPWNFSSSWAMENYSTPGPELGLGAMEQPRLTTPRPPSVAAGASRSRGAHGDFFSVAEIETIIKDKRLKEMVNTDPERVKRILNNRTSVAKLRPQRHAK